MTSAKWYEKAGKIFDSMESGSVLFYNAENGMYFSGRDGHKAYYIPDCEVLTSRNDSSQMKSNFLQKVFTDASDKGELATEVTNGKVHNDGFSSCALRLSNSENTVYVQERFTREFPANTLYYISGRNKPVLACLEDGGQLYQIAIVMPVLSNHFTPKEQAST